MFWNLTEVNDTDWSICWGECDSPRPAATEEHSTVIVIKINVFIFAIHLNYPEYIEEVQIPQFGTLLKLSK